MTQAIWNGAVIAESEVTSVVEGNHYFPADSVRWDLLEANDRQTVCHWKGTANYYDIIVAGETKRGAVWQYQNPSPAAEKIKGHVAFGGGVKVEPTPADGDDPTARAPGLLRRLLSGEQQR